MLVKDIIKTLSHYPVEAPLKALPYTLREGPRVMLAVPSMAEHMSDEGWQLALAFEASGYKLYGRGMGGTDVKAMLDKEQPSVVFVQDEHEWNGGHLAVRGEYFDGISALKDRPDVFKVTVVKDTHRQYESAKRNSEGIGCHAWLTYYSVDVSLRTLSWLRPEHTVRTYHTVDRDAVPVYVAEGRKVCILSGSMGGAYPLRTRIKDANLRGIDYIKHPGYGNRGTSTPGYLKQLSGYKVAVCTASKFGYALRKLIEATACGCRVVTDLPSDEVMPGIDANLVRVEPDIPMPEMGRLILDLANGYSPKFQRAMVEAAVSTYDYRIEGDRVAAEVERVRLNYGEAV